MEKEIPESHRRSPGIKNADDNLAQLRKALDELGLAASTNIIISSDHGFSTISKESKTSPSAKIS